MSDRFEIRLFSPAFIAVMAISASLAAQPEPKPIEPTLGRQIAAQLATLLVEEYVIAETGREMAARLRVRLALGKYDSISDPSQLASAITKDLHVVFNDGHLGVLEPARYEKWKQMFGDPDDDRLREGEEPHEGGAHQDEPHSGGPHAREIVQNTAITASRIMNRDGRSDVGYLELSRFDGSIDGLKAIVPIMNSFRDIDALIYDLRNCPGGDAEMVRALSSYLFAEPTHLVNTIGAKDAHGNRTVTERWTVPSPMGDALADIPVYILTSERTYSAAESFSFGLQRAGRATIVGETTGGGGHMNNIFSLPGGFGASISVGRTYDPETGEGWQTVGVAPDIACEFDHALSTTLETIATAAAASARLDEGQAAVHATLQAYANAWYTGDADQMSRLMNVRITGHHFHRDGTGLESFGTAQLIAMTDAGAGRKTPRALRNRVIRVGEVHGRVASAELVLRETVHLMQLIQTDGGWEVISDVITDKSRH